MNRTKIIKELKGKSFDLLVIGGGITGVGIALDAQLRGLNTALVEMQDFSAGTSSRSTKLVHGGLRYLKQFDFSLVMEVGRERAIVHRLAPHLVHPDKMLLPLIKDGNYGKILTNVGLMIYDWLANVEQADQRVMLTKEEAINQEPLLREDILEGAGFYAEYRTDDSRLVISVAKVASQKGAKLANYLEVVNFINNEVGRVIGIEVRDHISGENFNVFAKKIVNATGPWVDNLRKKDKSLKGKRLHLTKGVHIVIPFEKLQLSQTVYFDNQDGRMLFAIPRNNIIYLGTTDTNYSKDITNPKVNKADVEYIIEAINNMFPLAKIKISDVLSSWAGLRPLIHEEGKDPSELSRKDEIFHSKTGLISIAGGKLTGYRKMAEKVVDQVVSELGIKTGKCTTDSQLLDGNGFENYQDVEDYIVKLMTKYPEILLKHHQAKYLVYNYGINSDKILKIKEDNPQYSNIESELIYTIEEEMVQTALDFFERRTGRMNFDIESVKSNASNIIEILADKLKWNEKRVDLETKKLKNIIESKTTFL